jgi:hypothetical protein
VDVGLVDRGLVDVGLVDVGLVDVGLVDVGLVDVGLIDIRLSLFFRRWFTTFGEVITDAWSLKCTSLSGFLGDGTALRMAINSGEDVDSQEIIEGLDSLPRNDLLVSKSLFTVVFLGGKRPQ